MPLHLGTGDESAATMWDFGDLGASRRLFSILSTRKLILDELIPPESTTLLLVREKMPRPVPMPPPSTLLRLALELGHSALQLFDRLKPDESRPVLAGAGVCGEEERRCVN